MESSGSQFIPQLTSSQKQELEKQQYRIIGYHSAVKICTWTKNSIRNQGVCYKQLFYGIKSHQCMQMTTSMSCASRCKFCWRGLKAPVAKEWQGPANEPEEIIEGAIKAQAKLLSGIKGFAKANQELVKEAKQIKHAALSLTGEPIIYPKINEIISAFHKRKISTFLVTNAQYPEQLKALDPVTQLYLSIDAPNKALLKEIDRPLFPDFEERMLQCLTILKNKKQRTCIRLTMIKGINMIEPENYASLVKQGSPDFVELKSYMHVGASMEYYGIQHMPSTEEILAFSQELLKFLPDYEFIESHDASRAILLMKKSLQKKKLIDFEKFFELANNNSKDFTAEDYSFENPALKSINALK